MSEGSELRALEARLCRMEAQIAQLQAKTHSLAEIREVADEAICTYLRRVAQQSIIPDAEGRN